jgi:hypothetical protein
LNQAIEVVEKIWGRVRQNAVDREAAVKDMGFSGLSGHSQKMLSNLVHFNLVEKAGKGGIRVTDTAVQILHPRSEEERKQALNAAAYSSELFGQIKANFPDGFVSENALRNYLMREGYTGVAVTPAIRSYMETYGFLRQEDAIDSYRQEPPPESFSIERDEAGSFSILKQYPIARIEQPAEPLPSIGVKIMSGERVAFVEESGPDQYLKLVVAGQMDETLLEALEDFIKRQKKRLKTEERSGST